ncbi:MAG: hypothetical protein R6X13_07080 [bacterium]
MLSCLIVLVLAMAPVTAEPTQSVGTVIVDAELDAVPQRMNLQGYLTTAGGEPVNDTLQMVFRIWRGGSAVWTETQNDRVVHNGLFSVGMGSVTPIPSSVFEPGTPCSLEVTVAGTTLPKVEITSVGFAYRSVKSDTALYAQSATAQYADSAGGAVRVGGQNLTGLDARYVNEGQASSVTSAMITDGAIAAADIATGAVTSAKILDGAIAAADLNQMGAGTGQVLKWTGSAWAPRNDSVGGGAGDNAWARSDSVLYTVHQLGIARGGAGNVLYGNDSAHSTHVNFGVVCTTGSDGSNHSYCTVGGGYGNTARQAYTTVGGGIGNVAQRAGATIGGGYYNFTSGERATVSGGLFNAAEGMRSTVGGGFRNWAAGSYSAIPGGEACTTTGSSAFAVGNESKASHSNSAAFNGQITTASNQTRVGALSKASGTFTIDHPLDPNGKILNHYFIEGPEMLNIYRGSVVLNTSGRAEVSLPDYFDALNRNPMVHLTGVGTHEVHVAEDVTGNRFAIGGKPGVKVYWSVTGERKDVSAEATRRMMPVEQQKTGVLAGRMLDDEFISGCMIQLVQEGKADGIGFRTTAGRARYERRMRDVAEMEQK